MDITTDFVKILKVKRCSQSTMDSYRSHLLLAKSYFGNKTFKQIRDGELFEFIYHPVDSKNISASCCELCNKPGIGHLPLKRKLLPRLLRRFWPVNSLSLLVNGHPSSILINSISDCNFMILLYFCICNAWKGTNSSVYY